MNRSVRSAVPTTAPMVVTAERTVYVFPWRQVVDTQEFDPKLKDVFAEARKKAEANLQARGVVRQLGYCHAYWAELKKVLQEAYKIRWWSPTDLNGGAYD